jgi:hypothetical protein
MNLFGLTPEGRRGAAGADIRLSFAVLGAPRHWNEGFMHLIIRFVTLGHARKQTSYKKISATAANFDPGPVPTHLDQIKEIGTPGT